MTDAARAILNKQGINQEGYIQMADSTHFLKSKGLSDADIASARDIASRSRRHNPTRDDGQFAAPTDSIVAVAGGTLAEFYLVEADGIVTLWRKGCGGPETRPTADHLPTERARKAFLSDRANERKIADMNDAAKKFWRR